MISLCLMNHLLILFVCLFELFIIMLSWVFDRVLREKVNLTYVIHHINYLFNQQGLIEVSLFDMCYFLHILILIYPDLIFVGRCFSFDFRIIVVWLVIILRIVNRYIFGNDQHVKIILMFDRIKRLLILI